MIVTDRKGLGLIVDKICRDCCDAALEKGEERERRKERGEKERS
jgi:hypothetical protein